MKIDINFNFISDSNGKDPDSHSPTLKRYHKLLWSKELPNGSYFDLIENKGSYLDYNSEQGEVKLGSDAISHSYKNQKRKQWIVNQVPEEVDELFDLGCTIGAYTLFPRNQINRKRTINQSRGMISSIDDRFDLTLECIRLFYLGQKSPLYDTFIRYQNFFSLFVNFEGYIHFFLLEDLIDNNQNVKFYLPFDGFKVFQFKGVDEYLLYKNRMVEFIHLRNERILKYSQEFIN